MSIHDETYNNLLTQVLKGTPKSDRTGTGTNSVFGTQHRYDLTKGFPLLTTKKVHFKALAVELLWFLRGDTNVGFLHDHGVTIWDEWADEGGNLGPIYGHMWRSFGASDDCGYEGKDQIVALIDEIKTNPTSRRHILTAWDPDPVGIQALPPCHILAQFYVNDGVLSCQMYQRSGDVFLGVPFNIASYALLTHMVAQVTGLRVGEFIHTIGDAHLYVNHQDQALEQLDRPLDRPAPTLFLNPRIKNIDDFTLADIVIHNYKPHPPIKADVAV